MTVALSKQGPQGHQKVGSNPSFAVVSQKTGKEGQRAEEHLSQFEKTKSN